MGKHRHLQLASAVSACVLLSALIATPVHAATRQFKNDKAAADSFQKKVDYIKQNAAAPQPSSKPTVFSQEEINAYFAERRLNMPEGVKSVIFDLGDGMVTARTHVDFGQIRKDRPNMNPLLGIFDGEHDCQVVAYAEPAGAGMVRVRVDSVQIDGMTVPKVALRMFIDHYVHPKYPNVNLDGEYHLPARIDSATIAPQKGTTIQK